MSNYTRELLNINNILLDVENPRFASCFERLGKQEPTQDDVMLYLQENESVSTLAANIRATKGLHPAESIVCIQEDDKYIVLEGNRRVCACKSLCRIYAEGNIGWVSNKVIPAFPILNIDTDKELIDNISNLDAVVYATREEAQPYISDKHIDGVKKWESIEKSSYFYRMFQDRINASTNGNFNAEAIIEEIAKNTISQKNDIKECVIKYSFFMSVYTALLGKYQADKLTETNSYLPLVDRFMGTIVENSDLGLALPMSDRLCYTAQKGKETLLKEVLFLIGEAFIARKTGDLCSETDLSPITSTEVDSKRKQKKLIRENVRIPGLLDALNNYKTAPVSEDDDVEKGNHKAEKSPSEESDDTSQSAPNESQPADEVETIDDTPFENSIPWIPKQPKRQRIGFSKTEYDAFSLSDNEDGDVKIKFVIRELSRLSVNEYPYACSLLYRTLLESATRKAFAEKSIKENGQILLFKENDLAGMMLKTTNNATFLTAANRGAIKDNLTKQNFIKTLNDYIHNPKLVDTNLLISSWVTMKEYVKACLT
jgi:hypothetical protein